MQNNLFIRNIKLFKFFCHCYRPTTLVSSLKKAFKSSDFTAFILYIINCFFKDEGISSDIQIDALEPHSKYSLFPNLLKSFNKTMKY